MPMARVKLFSTVALLSLVVASLALLPAASAAPGTTTRVSAASDAATVLLEDNFDAENAGVGELNYTRFANWEVSDGTVDLIGNGFFDFLPGNGLYVDLDGTSSDAGRLTSKATFTLEPGDYELSFRLAGSQMGDTNTVTVTLGTVFSETFTLPGEAPFDTVTRTISVASATTGQLSFDHAGGDNEGLKLDTVTLQTQGASTADLSLAKADAPDPVLVGQALTYTLTVANSGPSPATGVMLTDTLPDNVTFGSATPSQGSCSPSGVTVNCDLGSLASGANATVEIVVTPTAAGPLTNAASTQGNEADPDQANNSATQATTVNPLACPPEIGFGQTISCTIETPNEVDRFTFVSGGRIQARAVRTSGTRTLNVSIYDANGRQRCSFLPPPVTFGTDVAIDCTIPTAGGEVRVRGDGATGVTGYNLSAQRLDNPDQCTPVSFGSTTPGVIDPIGKDDCYPFDSVRGGRIQARVVRTSGNGRLNVAIYDADGRLRCSFLPPPVTYGTDVATDCTIPTAGGHVRVSGDATTAATGYNLSVQRLNNPGGCVGPVGFGTTTPGVIDPIGEDDCYPFDSVRGGRIQARVVRTSGNGRLNVAIYDADGRLRCSFLPPPVTYGTDVATDCTIPTAGGHVRVSGDATTAATGYNLSVQRLNNPDQCTPVAIPSDTDGVIDPIGEDDCYTFDSAHRAVIQARVVRTSGTGLLNVAIYDADGRLRCSDLPPPVTYGTEVTARCEVPTAGGHVRVSGDATTAATGYNLSVQRS